MMKKLAALMCVICLVMTPSFGVMAAEPDILATSEPQPVSESVNQGMALNGTADVQDSQTEASNTEEKPVIKVESSENTQTPPDTQADGLTEGKLNIESQVEAGKEESGNSNPANQQAVVESVLQADSQNVNLSGDAKASLNDSKTVVKIGTELNPGGEVLESGKPYKGTNGTITWDEENNTLEFKDFKLELTGEYEKGIMIVAFGDATFILTGDNCIVAREGIVRIGCEGKLNITGGGSLTMESANSSVIAGSLNIEGVELTVNSSDVNPSDNLQGIRTVPFNESDVLDKVITISDSKVNGTNMPIWSYGDIQFKGKSDVTASGVKSLPGIMALGKITFGLTDGGRVTGNGAVSQYGPGMGIFALTGIELLTGNQIINPFNGRIIVYEEKDGTIGYCIANPDGTPAFTATVTGAKTDDKQVLDGVLHEQGTVAGSAPDGSKILAVKKQGVSTGDLAATTLWLLLLLAAAGCAGVVIKKKRELAKNFH